MANDEVLQVYFVPQAVRQPSGAPTPKRQLIDFEPLHAQAGVAVRWKCTVQYKQLELVDVNGIRSAVPGIYKLYITNGVSIEVSTSVNNSYRLQRTFSNMATLLLTVATAWHTSPGAGTPFRP